MMDDAAVEELMGAVEIGERRAGRSKLSLGQRVVNSGG